MAKFVYVICVQHVSQLILLFFLWFVFELCSAVGETVTQLKMTNCHLRNFVWNFNIDEMFDVQFRFRCSAFFDSLSCHNSTTCIWT